MSEKFIKEYLKYPSELVISSKDNINDLSNLSNLIAKKINSKGRIYFIAAGPIAILLKSYIKSLKYLFKYDNNKFFVIEAAKKYANYDIKN